MNCYYFKVFATTSILLCINYWTVRCSSEVPTVSPTQSCMYEYPNCPTSCPYGYSQVIQFSQAPGCGFYCSVDFAKGQTLLLNQCLPGGSGCNSSCFGSPTVVPTTVSPSMPTQLPTSSPTNPTFISTITPTIPTAIPTSNPTNPTAQPASWSPTVAPTPYNCSATFPMCPISCPSNDSYSDYYLVNGCKLYCEKSNNFNSYTSCTTGGYGCNSSCFGSPTTLPTYVFNTVSSSSSGSNTVSTGVIVGIVFGAVAFVVSIFICTLIFLRLYKKPLPSDSDPELSEKILVDNEGA